MASSLSSMRENGGRKPPNELETDQGATHGGGLAGVSILEVACGGGGDDGGVEGGGGGVPGGVWPGLGGGLGALADTDTSIDPKGHGCDGEYGRSASVAVFSSQLSRMSVQAKSKSIGSSLIAIV